MKRGNPYEVVKTADVFHFIERAEPGIENKQIAQRIERSERNVYRLKNEQETMLLTTADRILTAFDLSYLLSTGDIPTEQRRLKANRMSWTTGTSGKGHEARRRKLVRQ